MSNFASISFEGLRRQAVKTLTQAGIDGAASDVRILLCAASGLSPTDLIIHAQDPVPTSVLEKFQIILSERQTHKPIAQIIGRQEFWSLSFKVTPDVLVPRPETELLVEAALEILAASRYDKASPKILDVGTGTGAILISLLHALPNASGFGVDISKAALSVAAQNAALHDVDNRCAFAVSDYLSDVEGTFDMVVSNPPYITDAAMETLPKTVRAFEPHLALGGGADGLVAYQEIIQGLSRVLKPKGSVVFEIGYDQKDAVTALLAEIGADEIMCHPDLAGHDRIISAKII